MLKLTRQQMVLLILAACLVFIVLLYIFDAWSGNKLTGALGFAVARGPNVHLIQPWITKPPISRKNQKAKLSFGQNLSKVQFSDERTINLLSLMGNMFNWEILETTGSVMVCRMLSAAGVGPLNYFDEMKTEPKEESDGDLQCLWSVMGRLKETGSETTALSGVTVW